ncbi:hypothetical protein BDN71DRAFT_602744 [Pleurotus eryngii]|uniref:Uncharacterized protein n=1 Tax=Pleurotus eryngii TaxID=5323 RepID=A0A9P5ZHQ1_PLEER|nr:hypothetical protein BDN71DRAFT_1594370 [Pleurotus eryngii]KAF9487672.1 hypothetical protein BDN71DRAFT_602744 [Pleurotus eryngii]
MRNNRKQRERGVKLRSACGSKGKEAERVGEVGQKEKEKEKDGTCGFMGGMRQISAVGKHKRSKSAASMAFVGESGGASDVGTGRSDEPSLPDLPKEALMMTMSKHAAGEVSDGNDGDNRKTLDRTFCFHLLVHAERVTTKGKEKENRLNDFFQDQSQLSLCLEKKIELPAGVQARLFSLRVLSSE